MSNIILMSGSEAVTRAAVVAVPVPERTRSYNPVSYGAALDFVQSTCERTLGLPVASESYGLNKKGDQMFAMLSFDVGDVDSRLCIGLRQSYNKSLSLGTCGGANIMVCDNLCFDGDSFKIMRKNTTNVWADFKRMIREQVGSLQADYRSMREDIALLKATPCNTRRGFSFLGVAQGEGLLTPNQASVAFGDWTTPRHAEFAERNMWGLYNAMTEGLKKGNAARTIDRHAAAHGFMVEMCNTARPSRPALSAAN